MTDADLIREYRQYLAGGGHFADSLIGYATALADALERCGAELERARAAAVPMVFRPATGKIIPDLTGIAHICEWQSNVRALAAEADAKRLRAMAREIEQIILPDPYDERETDRGWMRDRIRAAIDAALTAEGQRGET